MKKGDDIANRLFTLVKQSVETIALLVVEGEHLHKFSELDGLLGSTLVCGDIDESGTSLEEQQDSKEAARLDERRSKSQQVFAQFALASSLSGR